jgi:flagellar motor protein MotB
MARRGGPALINRSICALAFLSGAAVVAWVGAGFVAANPLALLMTLVIAVVYLLGALELLDFRRATASLAQALAAIPEQLASLADWLGRLHPSLQNPVRLRIEGERIGLPGPALTPYLVGLLVMLGMLGTFLGMVVTLDGVVAALHGTTDLQAMRAELATPIRGLGLAFGTSVAGVAASAMLGLISALSRRDRALAAQLLDARIATGPLRAFSLSQQRQEGFRALQLQAQAMPAVVDRLQALMEQMERRQTQLGESLVAGQERFHGEVQAAYDGLARSVAAALDDSLRTSARVAGENIRPAVEGAMAAIARETRLAHERVIESTGIQLGGLAARFGETAQSVAQTWTEVLEAQRGTSDRLLAGIEHSLAAFDARLEQRSQALLAAVGETLSTSLANQAAAERQRFAAWTGSLADLAAAARSDWQAAEAQMLARQQQLCATLEKTAQAVSEQAQAHAARTLEETARLFTCAEDLVRSRIAGEADWIAGHGERMDQMAGLWRSELGALRDAEARRGDAAVERLGELQAALALHLQTLGAALEEPLATSDRQRVGGAACRCRTHRAVAPGDEQQPGTGQQASRRARPHHADARFAAGGDRPCGERTADDDRLAGHFVGGAARHRRQPLRRRGRRGIGAACRSRRATRRQRRRGRQPRRSLCSGRPVVRRRQREADRQPAADRGGARPIDGEERRATRVLRCAGARTHRSLAHGAGEGRRRVAPAWRQGAIARRAARLMDDSDAGVEQIAPVWTVFGDLMSGLLGAFVLILIGVLGVQLELATHLESEVQKRKQEEQRRMALEKALAIPITAGRVSLNDGRIGISGSVLFLFNSAQLQPEGRLLLKSLVAPLRVYLGERNELLMVSGFTDDVPIHQGSTRFADNWELSAQRALTVTRALIDEGMPSSLVFAAAFGAEQPVASNADDRGRSRNRRVEMAPVPRSANPGKPADG